MKKRILATLLVVAPAVPVHAASDLYYDSLGFEDLAATFVEGPFVDTSSQALTVLHVSNPQPEPLFDGSTLETLRLNDNANPVGIYYNDTSGTGGNYSLGMMGAAVGSPVLNPVNGNVLTTNYDVFSLPVDIGSCPGVTGVRVEFDLSLSALLRDAASPLAPIYYIGEVVPTVAVGLFDYYSAASITPDFDTQLQNSVVSGSPSPGMEFSWTHHSVTLPLAAADLVTSEAILTLSGNYALPANQRGTPYIAIDNVQVYLESPAGCVSASAQPVPAGNFITLLLSMAGLVGVAGLSVFGFRRKATA